MDMKPAGLEEVVPGLPAGWMTTPKWIRKVPGTGTPWPSRKTRSDVARQNFDAPETASNFLIRQDRDQEGRPHDRLSYILEPETPHRIRSRDRASARTGELAHD